MIMALIIACTILAIVGIWIYRNLDNLDEDHYFEDDNKLDNI